MDFVLISGGVVFLMYSSAILIRQYRRYRIKQQQRQEEEKTANPLLT